MRVKDFICTPNPYVSGPIDVLYALFVIRVLRTLSRHAVNRIVAEMRDTRVNLPGLRVKCNSW